MKPYPKPDRGSTLFVVLFFMAVLSVFVGAAFSLTTNTANISSRSTQMTLAYAVADGAMELVYSRWRSIVSFSTARNLNARVFIKPDSVYNAEGKDITVVSLADLGLPPGYLGLTSNPNDKIATITIRTVDAAGREYGNYDGDGRCTDSDTILVEATKRTGFDASSNNFYPAPVSPDFNFRVASPSANSFQSVEMVYRVDVAVTVGTRTTPLTARVRRHFTRSLASAAQAAYFYEDRLEIIPGTNTTINGKVHTNKDLWVSKRVGVDVKFNDRVTTVDKPVYNANPVGSSSVGSFDTIGGSVSVSSVFVGGAPQEVSPMAVGGINRSYLQPYDATNNPNLDNNSLREIIETPTTKTGVDPYYSSPPDYSSYFSPDRTKPDQRAVEEARAYANADLKILVVFNSDGTIDTSKTIIRERTDISSGKADGANITGSARTAILNSITGRVAIADGREAINGASVKATVVDMKQLKTAMESYFFDSGGAIKSDYGSYRGQVYISDVTYTPSSGTYNPFLYGTGPGTYETTGAGGVVKHALLIKNGEDLPGSAAASPDYRNFTLATQNAVYIQGDYNTGGKGSEVPSNTVADGSTRKAGATTVTSAVMADAITVVSSAFKPERSGAGIDDLDAPIAGVAQLARGAVATTVNTAIVTGQYQSNDSGFSGGATNIIRFLENWETPNGADPGSRTRKQFTYSGSIMQSYTSREFANPFISPSVVRDVYNPPVRRVDFENSFLESPPVGFPATITYTKGTWSRPTS